MTTDPAPAALPPAPKLSVNHDTYRIYDEYSAVLQSLVARWPELATLRSLGHSRQGRDLWAVTISDPAGGPHLEKPGYYIDAQIHAEEHATSATALYAVNYLLERSEHDEEIKRLLRENSFYILPRINPDGAEVSLTTAHRWCGNGRYALGQDEVTRGLHQWDIDGDGTILYMRVPDPNGEWKLSERDPRVMLQRAPHERGGTYYRLYPEGLIPDWDGAEPDIEAPRDGNLNRDFPANWFAREYGAGDYPGSEPEAKAVMDFLLAHPNICGLNSYHTHGGVILRPSSSQYDHQLSSADLNLFRDLGALGTAITGYPVISIYEDFTPDKSKARHGSLTDWMYEEKGVPIFATELWDLESAAGLRKDSWYGMPPRTEAESIQMLDWIEREVGPQGFRPWTPFLHPQLGAVEIGGINEVWTYRNPPGHLLEDLCYRNVRFCLAHAGANPRLEVADVQCRALGGGQYHLQAVVGNAGYLPTNLTDLAVQHEVARPVTATLQAQGSDPVRLHSPATLNLGHLAGRNGRKVAWSPWGSPWQRTRRPVSWFFSAAPGATLTIEARSEKGWVARHTLRLD